MMSSSTRYIYNTGFTKTAKFWCAEDQNEHGAIYSTIDDTGGTYPMAEVDNSSRVIKYVALRTHRYSEEAMPGLRIHDITLVADLNAHDPTVVNPCDVVFDGTVEGSGDSDSPNTTNALSIASLFVTQQLITEWVLEVFWPVCHIMFEFMFSTNMQRCHFTLDLLGQGEFKALSADADSSVNDFFGDISDWIFATIFAGLLQSAVAAINIFDMAMQVPGNQANPYVAVALGVAIVLTILAYTIPVAIIENQVADGTISHGKAAGKYFSLFIMTLAVLSSWKTLNNVLSAGTVVLLGFVGQIYFLGAGVWGSWFDEVYNWKCRWGKLILIGAVLIFGGLMVYHFLESLSG